MKRKKKQKASIQHSKQEQRARFNTFKRRIVSYLQLFGCGEVARLFNESSYRNMYEVRNVCLPKIVMDDGVDDCVEIRNDIISKFEMMYSNKNIEINDQLKVSPKEILSALIMMDCAVKDHQESIDINKKLLVQKYLEAVGDFSDLITKALDKVEGSMQAIGMVFSEMNTSLCWLEYKRKDDLSTDNDSRDKIVVHEHIPKKRMMIIDNHPRPVYPLMLNLPNIGPKEITIPVEKIKLPKSTDRKRIPVYVQNHLVHRLKERLDCLPSFISEMFLCYSILQNSFIYYNGKILVEYFMDSTIKLGYIVLEFCNDVLLAKTFLLLSNTGTPEGEKLNQISGMKKFDHKYWAIDKLSTFHNSDLKDHPQMRKIFEDAGCGSLFEEVSFPDEYAGTSCTTQASQMIRYLEGIPQDEYQLVAI